MFSSILYIHESNTTHQKAKLEYFRCIIHPGSEMCTFNYTEKDINNVPGKIKQGRSLIYQHPRIKSVDCNHSQGSFGSIVDAVESIFKIDLVD